MMNKNVCGFFAALAIFSSLTACGGGGGGASPAPVVETVPSLPPVMGNYRVWMHPDVKMAWDKGYGGKGALLTFIDEYDNADTSAHRLVDNPVSLTHGGKTSLIASLVAPDANLVTYDYDTDADSSVKLDPNKFNIINMSYGRNQIVGYEKPLPRIDISAINAAKNGAAVVVLAAGNEWGKRMTDRISFQYGGYTFQYYDGLVKEFRDAQSVIFAGALEKNGTVTNPASIADYSSIPGGDREYQKRYLMVGVDAQKMGVEGTSFAAPIIAGYAAIVHSKFPDATPVQVTNQLLDTATTNTIRNYNPYYHGQGEASLKNALAPVSIR